MQTVNYETARRLKAAGFPQPKPEFGQIWYALPAFDSLARIEAHDRIVITGPYEGKAGITYFNAIGETGCVYDPYEADAHICYAPENLIYAPTAADILRQLPFMAYALMFDPNIGENQWGLYDVKSFVDGAKITDCRFWGNNLAEVCAMAWLSINETEQSKQT